MKTTIALIVAFLLTATTLNAQNLRWVKTFGGASIDAGSSIKVDASGNVYTTGYFLDTVDFDPGAGAANLTAVGGWDIFVQKMDSSGNFLWAKSFGGTSSDFGYSITVDASGNIYTTGSFSDTVDFDPGPGIANLTAVGYEDIFVQKMDASGNFLWAKSFGGANPDRGNSITLDATGNVYTTGSFEYTVDFDPGVGTANLTAVGNYDIFVQKMDSSGNFLWAKSFGGFFVDAGNSITVDATGNVYTTGFFDGTVDFDPGAGTASMTSVGYRDIFVQKMDSSGNFLWAKSFGGIDDDYGNAITVDGIGNVYTTGFYRGTVDFDPGAGTDNHIAVGNDDIFVQKMDASGNFLWAKSFGGTYYDFGNSIAVDGIGNVYTTGIFMDTVDFDPGTGAANLTAVGSNLDIFVQKMDASGNFLWAIGLGGIDNDEGYSITVDGFGNVYTTGYFEDTVDFDPGVGTANLSTVGLFDVFVQKMGTSATSGIVEIGKSIQIKAYPNPSSGLVQLSFEQALNNVAITVTDIQGKVVFSKHFDATANEQINIDGSAGIYFLNVKTPAGQTVVKLIKE